MKNEKRLKYLTKNNFGMHAYYYKGIVSSQQFKLLKEIILLK